jgi:hypothetical protein
MDAYVSNKTQHIVNFKYLKFMLIIYVNYTLIKLQKKFKALDNLVMHILKMKKMMSHMAQEQIVYEGVTQES